MLARHLLMGSLMVWMVRGHGRLIDPPSRNTMWRFGYNTPICYNDNEKNCGGFGHQWNRMKGKCGICGDAYDGVRESEAGGRYATGIIARRYTEGQVIAVQVALTANHRGYFEFHICPNNDPGKRATAECLARHPLKLANGEARYILERFVPGIFTVDLKLPWGLVCSQCVLQWKYNSGNNWGCDETRCCIGCGPQEQFYGCADVSIGESGAGASGTSSRTSTTEASRPRDCRARPEYQQITNLDVWCITNCAHGNCPSQFCEQSCLL